MWAIAFGTPEAILFRGTHLLFALVLVFLLYRATSCRTMDRPTRSSRPTTGCRRCSTTCCSALAAAPIIYLFVNYEYIVTRIYYIDDLVMDRQGHRRRADADRAGRRRGG